MSRILCIAALGALVLAAGCGSGGGGGDGGSTAATPTPATPTPAQPTPAQPTPTSTPPQNVQAITVNSGPTNDYVDGVFTDVTICVPGNATDCRTIGGILVDTGSSGLRVLASTLSLSLPLQVGAGGAAIGECFPFLNAVTWGSVRLADLRLAGEQANAVPIQVIGDPSFSPVPPDCTSTGMPVADTLESLGANGILGIGAFKQDCGEACAVSGSANPGLYYACSAAGCGQASAGLSAQVQNPVSLFPVDHNGVVIELPSVPAGGSVAIGGSLTLGIGTEPNNGLGDAIVLTLAPQGTFTTTYAGKAYGLSFIDSGSNGIFFLDTAATGLPDCVDSPAFYCPGATRSQSASNRGANGAISAVTFAVANADSLFANPANFVFADLAGPNPAGFDWGLPFFFGRKVFTAIEGESTPAGPGPYWAY